MPSNTVEIEGIECEALSVARTGIAPGELYLARRNNPWQMLTVRSYHPYDPATCDANCTGCGIVYPVESAYPFNDSECFKVL